MSRTKLTVFGTTSKRYIQPIVNEMRTRHSVLRHAEFDCSTIPPVPTNTSTLMSLPDSEMLLCIVNDNNVDTRAVLRLLQSFKEHPGKLRVFVVCNDWYYKGISRSHDVAKRLTTGAILLAEFLDRLDDSDEGVYFIEQGWAQKKSDSIAYASAIRLALEAYVFKRYKGEHSYSNDPQKYLAAGLLAGHRTNTR